MMPNDHGYLKSPQDLDARFRLGWDQRGLLVLVTVPDDKPSEAQDITLLWSMDCVELFLADRRGGGEPVPSRRR